ncbi:MAG: energy-coupling factor ABC transporter ATP-binding protein [Saezia sp.]
MPLLQLESISYIYAQRETAILHNVSLELHAGEMLGLCGNNGSGKSTLLNIASGLTLPNSGTVTLCGMTCHTEKDFSPARKGLGYLLQNSDDMLFCPSILEDVAFGPYNHGKTSQEAQTIALNTLESLGITHLANFNGNNLSGGEKKLCALACILAMKPQLLFLDEPTNDLDPESRKNIIATLENLRIPSLIISHDTEFMQRLCTRFCTLENGILS